MAITFNMNKGSSRSYLNSVQVQLKMKHLRLFVFLSAFCCKALSLTCYQCIPETSLNCTETMVECGVGQCGYMDTAVYEGGTMRVEMVMKNCSLTQHCHTASVNFGATKTTISNQCCDTSLCNKIRSPKMMKNVPNGMKCYTCMGEDCSLQLDCLDDEDHCIRSTVDADGQALMMRGCATTSFCTGALSAHFNQSSSLAGFTCCEGNLCNNATCVTHLLTLHILLLFLVLLQDLLLFQRQGAATIEQS